MSEMRRNKKILLIVSAIGIAIYILLRSKTSQHNRGYYVDDSKERHPVSSWLKMALTNDTLFREVTHQKWLHPKSQASIEHYLRPSVHTFASYGFKPEVLKTQSDFSIDNDVIVYLHIQKVADTTFNRHLVTDLQLETPCNCEKDLLTNPCLCKNKNGFVWLFSWFSVGWPCGLHADWTMLHECVDNAINIIEGKPRTRRYFYITLLRDPVYRYLSEWKHVKLGNHWQDVQLRCDGQPVSYFDVRPCFSDKTWEGVSFYEFMDCPDNLATNRQTRMVADLTKSHCYQRNKLKASDRSLLQLESAVENIENMAFFGISESEKETQLLFEKTFNLKFSVKIQPLQDADDDERISEDEFVNMMHYIELDVQLYQRARELFVLRAGSA